MKKTPYLFVLGIFCCFALLGSCQDDLDRITPAVAPGNTEVKPISDFNKVIYEVNVRNYSAAGTIAALKNDLPRLKDLGVDILWLMPIHPIGEEKRQGTKGSPYAVKDYLAINPDLGTDADLKAFITTAHEQGMEVWLDWVANHTAWDHSWVKEHIDFYAEKNGQRPYSPDGWTDVVELDYSNPALRQAMIDAMKYWVSEFDIDGYRCDAVSFVPVDFWKEARAQVDAIKPITWLAESDNPAYAAVFDMDYAWAFNTSLNEFGHQQNLDQLVAACNKLVNNPNYAEKSRMVYLSNHDLNAFEGTEFSRYGNNVLPLTALYFTVYDMPLIYNGQEIGMNKALSLFEHDPIPWQPTNATYLDLFKRLTRLKRTQPALTGGKGRSPINRYPTNHDDQVLVYSRTQQNNEVLVMLNFSNNPIRFHFTTHSPIGEFVDYLKDGSTHFSTHDPLVLPANGYAIYVKNPQ